MTETLAEPVSSLAQGRGRSLGLSRGSAIAALGHLTTALALGWWALGLAHGSGGRDAHVLTIGEVLVVLALAATRAWRSVRASWLALAAAVAATPLLACVLDPTGWFGANQAASYGYSAAVFVLVAAYARSAPRTRIVVLLVLVAAAAQFAWSLVAWVGSGSPATRMVGTVYWHDQYAALLLGAVAMGAVLAVAASTPLRVAGAVVAMVGTAGIVFSTSRSVLALAVVGWLGALAVGTACARSRPRAALRSGVLAAATVALVLVLPGPPLFHSHGNPLQGTQDRAASGETLQSNTGYRVDFWRQAGLNFAHHPLSGTGFASFSYASSRYGRPGDGHSSLAHSAVMEALSDGGLLVGVPLLAAMGAIGWGVVRRLRPRGWRADGGVAAAAGLATLLLTAHALVDFDWTYPACFAMSAVLAALAVRTSADATRADTGSTDTAEAAVASGPRSRVAAVAVVVLLASCVAGGIAAVGGGWHLTAPDRALGAMTHSGVTAR